MAGAVATLAKGGFSWTEHYIFWQLPLPRLLQYIHAVLWQSGEWTVPAADVVQPAKVDFAAVGAFLGRRGNESASDL